MRLVVSFISPIPLIFFLFFVNANGIQSKEKELNNRPLRWFEYAYHKEKRAPLRSILMYQWALADGLGRQNDAKLEKTARWRLLYLHKESGQYLAGLRLLMGFDTHKKKAVNAKTQKKTFLKKLRNELEINLQKKYKLSDFAKQQIGEGVVLFVRGLQKKQVLKHFTQAWQDSFANIATSKANSQQLLLALLRFLCDANKSKWATDLLELIKKEADNPSSNVEWAYHLPYAGLQVEQGEYVKAEKTLSLLPKKQETKPAIHQEQLQINYLFGRIYRGQKRYFRSASSFEHAATFAPDKMQKNHLHFLAAYSLYLAQDILQAQRMLPQAMSDKHSDNYLLWLLVRYKNEKITHKQLRSKLINDAPYIEAKSVMINSRLARDLWKLL